MKLESTKVEEVLAPLLAGYTNKPAGVSEPTSPIKLDLGCGPNKKAGFLGADSTAFPGVDVVTDLRTAWPWKSGTIEEANASHFLEHLTGIERCHFFNELYRVLKPAVVDIDRKAMISPGGKATIVTPHWCSCRAYGDFTHQWPPVSEFFYFYLSRDWRMANAPHTDIKYNKDGYNCNFLPQLGHSFDGNLALKSTDYQQFALSNYKEAAQDLICTVTRD